MGLDKPWQFLNITTATTTTVKAGAGILKSIVFNKRVVSGVITIYDNTAASGTKIGTITLGAALLSDPPQSVLFDVPFSIGLTIVTSEAEDLTVIYGGIQ